MDEPKRKRRWWQFGIRELLIVTGAVGAELAMIRVVSAYRPPHPRVHTPWLTVIIPVLFLLAFPIGVSAGLIARKWEVAFWTTILVMAALFVWLWVVAPFL